MLLFTERRSMELRSLSGVRDSNFEYFESCPKDFRKKAKKLRDHNSYSSRFTWPTLHSTRYTANTTAMWATHCVVHTIRLADTTNEMPLQIANTIGRYKQTQEPLKAL